jgi:PAS domain S-box-containing protein/putative nucleotidyltransferase with HDIG domain
MSIVQNDRFLYINPKFCEIFGYDRGEVLGRLSPLDLVAETDRARVADILRSRLQGHASTVAFSFKGKRGDGSLVEIELQGATMQIGGQPALIGSLTDVTDRNRTMSLLRESGARIKRERDTAQIYLDIAGVMMLVLDSAGKVVLINRRGCKILGYDDAKEVTGKLWIDNFTPPRLRDQLRRDFGRLLAVDSGVEHYESPVLTRTGGERLIAWHNVPIADDKGTIVATLSSGEDITEKKIAERALQKTTRALKTLSEANAALVRASSRETLFQEMCRVAVEAGGYRMAWIGIPETDAEKTLRPVAHAGHEAGYLSRATISWADNERGRGIAGTAIRTRQIQVTRELGKDPRMTPWAMEAQQRQYASAIALPIWSGDRLAGVFVIYATETDAFGPEELELLSELGSDISYGLSALETRTAHEVSITRLARALEQTVQAIASTVEMRDPYTAGHQRRVAVLAESIARELHLPEERVHGLRLASIVHDLGKINIPAEILSKPGKLTAIEYEFIKTHPRVGYDILKSVEFPWPIADIVLQHHERLDGSGYPDGLKGDGILLEARILAVADVVDSMISHRPYRPARGLEVTLAEIQENSGRLYDAAVVQACVALIRSGKVNLDV